MKPSETSIVTSVVTPQNLPWQEVVSLVTQQLLGQTDSISALKAFIPLPPPLAQCNLSNFISTTEFIIAVLMTAALSDRQRLLRAA